MPDGAGNTPVVVAGSHHALRCMAWAIARLVFCGSMANMSHVALGGSNTLGAQDVGKPDWWRRSRSFSTQLQAFLQSHSNLTYRNSAVGGMGPILAASCMRKFVPSDARLATVEYIPNMGYTEEDSDEMAALERLIRTLVLRAAQVFVINIVPGSLRFVRCVGRSRRYGCQTRLHVKDISDRVAALAMRYNASVIVVDDDVRGDLFNADHMHVSQKGHDEIFAQIVRQVDLGRFARRHAASRESHDVAGAPLDMGVECMIGDDIAPLIRRRGAFSRVQLDRRTPPKVGWESRTPNARLTLCVPLPRSSSNESTSVRRYRLGLGMQVAGPHYVPRHGVLRVSCHGMCHCKCFKRSDRTDCLNNSYDTMTRSDASVTKFFRYFLTLRPHMRSSPCGPRNCLLRLHSADDPGRNRLVLRSVIVGIDDWHTNWLNEYHQDYANMGAL